MSEAARARALKILERRMRSEEEVRLDLLAKGFSSEEAHDAICYLYSYNYLDDAAYAAAYVRDKLRFSPQGPFKLRQGLLQRGVDSDLIDDVIAQEMPSEIVYETALKLGKKHQDKGKNKVQSMRYLYGRGFSESIVYSVIEELFGSGYGP